MTILYNASTGVLKEITPITPPTELLPGVDVYTLIQNDAPSYDAATQDLSPTETIDPATKTVTRGWRVSAKPRPTSPNPPPPCPPEVPALDLLDVLIDAGLYPTVTAAINGITDPKEKLKAQLRFQREGTIARNHPLVALVQQAAKKTDAEVDEFFKLAAAHA